MLSPPGVGLVLVVIFTSGAVLLPTILSTLSASVELTVESAHAAFFRLSSALSKCRLASASEMPSLRPMATKPMCGLEIQSW